MTSLLLAAVSATASSFGFTDRVIEITGHRSEVWSLGFLAPDGRTVISSSFDSLVIWDSEDGNELLRLIDRRTVYPFAVSPDGSRVLLVDPSGAELVDTETGESVLQFDPDLAQMLLWPVWSPDGASIATLGSDSLHVWNALSGELMRSLETRSSRVRTVAWSPDGSRIAVLAWDGMLQVFDTLQGTKEAAIDAHPGRGGLQLAWSPNGEFVATGGRDSLVKLWNTTDWSLTHALAGESTIEFGVPPPGGIGPPLTSGPPISALAFSPSGRTLASADEAVRVWNVATGEPLWSWSPADHRRSYVPHFGTITDLEFGPDGTYLASAGVDASAKVWDVTSGIQVGNIDSFFGAVERVSWSPQGSRVAMGGTDGAVVIWDVSTRQEQTRFEGHLRGTVVSLDFAPRVPRVVTSGRDGAVKVWFTGTGGQIFELHPVDQGVGSGAPAARSAAQVLYSPRSNAVLMRSDDYSGPVLELRIVSTRVGMAKALDSDANSVAWSPDARYVASAGYGVRIWDLRDLNESPVPIAQELYVEFSGDSGAIAHVAWSPDGERLLTASESGALVWDWKDGRRLWGVNPLEGATYVEEADDTSLLLTIDGQFRSPQVQTWSVKSGTETATFVREGVRVASARFMDGGKRVITTYTRDPVVRIWDSFTGQEMLALEGHGRRVLGIAVEPSRNLVATASEDRTVRVWNATSGKELAKLGPRPGPVIGVRFSPDGSQVAAYGIGGAVLWEPSLAF